MMVASKMIDVFKNFDKFDAKKAILIANTP